MRKSKFTESQIARILWEAEADMPSRANATHCIFQALTPLPTFAGRHALECSRDVGDRAAGIGIREDTDLITRNTSQFAPHYFR